MRWSLYRSQARRSGGEAACLGSPLAVGDCLAVRVRLALGFCLAVLGPALWPTPSLARATAAPSAPPATASVTGETALRAELELLLKEPVLRGARFGVSVSDVETGAPLLQFRADEPFHPASNTKLLTTAAALVHLGPTYTFQTDLVTSRLDASGGADDLVLLGRGDPSLMVSNLYQLVDEARLNGLRSVRGDVIIDESYLSGAGEPPGFAEQATDEAFRAPTGAASLNYNTVLVYVSAGSEAGTPVHVALTPDVGYVRVDNRGRTRARGRATLEVTAKPEGMGIVVSVKGRLPTGHEGIWIRKRVWHPAQFTGAALNTLLKQAGIPVSGSVRIGQAPAVTRRLSSTQSRAVSTLCADVNKFSNNFMAEQLLLALGVQKLGRGDFEAGREVVQAFARDEVGLGPLEYANGSGLFGRTQLSPAQIVKLLVYMQVRRPALPEFAASLAIGGLDGTMARRSGGAIPLSVRAKTGTLDGVVALSGYTTDAGGRTLAFSFLANDVPGGAWRVWKLHDRLLAVLAQHSAPKAP